MVFLWRKGFPQSGGLFGRLSLTFMSTALNGETEKRRLQMKNSMIRTLVTLGLSAVLSPVALLAQGPVTATIPFDFTVGAKTLAAGTYQVKQLNQSAILLRNVRNGTSILAPYRAGEVDKISGTPKLTFNRYGDSYFLTKVTSDTRNWAMYPSRAEKEMIAKAASTKSAVVTAALRSK
jgi:hypothetical protein